ncbi:MAG: AMP-binding protein [Methanomassiliicoccus sp.]|nr:AMP-binding protein [Methanomassiliicoccus sp.]
MERGTVILLTGGSGFIGTYVARWFLANSGHNITVLARGGDDREARDRLARVWGDRPEVASALGSRVEVLAGDVCKEDLGLEPSRYAELARQVDIIVHCAADIRLHAPLDELRETNVNGTRNVLKLAFAVHRDHGLKRFAHVSTAYVAGGRRGAVREDELTDQYGFLSNYERSKYEAETVVRGAMDELPISIFRPGMVVGASDDGYVRTFNTLYYPLRLYLAGKVKVLPISPSQRVNLVPVDHVAEMIARLSLDPRAEGRTFHAVGDPATLPTVRELVNATRSWALEHLGVSLPRPVYLPILQGTGAKGPAKDLAPLAGYLQERREFLRTNADDLLGHCPVDWHLLLPKLLEFGTYTGFLHRSDRTVHEQVLFRLTSKRRPVRMFDIVDGETRERPAAEVRGDMLRAAAALHEMGIGKGDRVAIVGANSTRYLTLDVAIGMVGGISVPLYYTSPPRELDEQVASSGARLLLIGSGQVLKRAREMQTSVPMISFCRSVPEEMRSRALSWEEFLDRGVDEERARSPAGLGDIATLRYTSSTTGPAKGVLFDHDNLRYMAESTASLPPWEARNSQVVYLSFLPMNHVVEGILATYSPFYAPAAVDLYFLEEFRELRNALPKVRPTVFFSVPRFFEKLHSGLVDNPNAMRVMARPSKPTSKLLASAIGRQALRRAGLDRCAYLISGSGVMSPAILRDLRVLGIEVHNAYGLTEAPLVTINRRGCNVIGTVGTPLPRTEVAIAEDGEVLVRGPQVTRGYDGLEEDPFHDGWLLTGDTGHIADDGSLVLQGRKKELIKTAYGKYVNPLKVETMMRSLPGVEEAMVVGEGRPYGVALLWVGGRPAVDDIDAAIVSMNEQLARPEQIRAWAVLPNDLSVERGELTANMKLRRPRLVLRYQPVIESLYSGQSSAPEALHVGRAGRET